MKKYFLSAAFLIFVFSISAFAQVECINPGTEYERNRCDEKFAENARLAGRGFTRFEKADKSLLSDKPDAWVLHVITTGGFTGRGLPTVTIRSNGDVACGEAESLQFKSFGTGKLNALSEIITLANFTITDSLTKIKTPGPFFCSDCYQTKILLARREENGKVRFYENGSKLMKYSEIAEKFNLIQRSVFDLIACE